MVRRYHHRMRGTAALEPVQANEQDPRPVPTTAQADGPIWARLVAWAPLDRLAAAEAGYEAELAPLLARHGLIASPDSLGLRLGSCFVRVCKLGSLAELIRIEAGLSTDTLLYRAAGHLQRRLGVTSLSFGLFDPLTETGGQVPAGPGRRTLAGTGSHTGPWHRLGVADGLPDPAVLCVYQDRQGDLWFGTDGGGVSRYDGEEFVTFTTADGLPSNVISHILEDRDGGIWLGAGTWRAKPRGSGVARYDGTAFQTLLQRDGLAHDAAQQVLQDRQGDFWIATEGGLTRYRPRHESFPVTVSRVTADRDYGPAAEVTVSSSQEYLAFEFIGRSLRTRPGWILYLYRLEGRDADWRPTRERRVTYGALPVGEYRFQVRAVDRDLSYSEPASVTIHVRWPYERLGWMAALGLAGLAVAWQTARVVRRDRRLQQSNQALAQANLDLTEANQQVQAATRRKSEFLSSMSHDLRTPMNAIIGYTRLLLRKLQGVVDERQLRNLQNIETSAGHLHAMINEILELSRVESGRLEVHPQQVGLRQLTAECMAAVGPLVKPAVELRQELTGTLSLRTDPEILRKVLMNLLENAVKFTTEGSITLSVQPADERIEMAVADTGIGIPAADLPLIFEEFRQVARQGSAEKEGTGLGLAIARRSVELLGGTIAAQSEVGRGTRFTVRLQDLAI